MRVPAAPITLALVNDYEVVVAGLAQLLRPFEDRVLVVDTEVRDIPADPVDIVIYDTFAAPNGSNSRIHGLLASANVGKVVGYSFNDNPQAARDSIACGAEGYISKAVPVEQLVDALERIHRGETVIALGAPDAPSIMEEWPGQGGGLTAREAEIIGLITQGYSNQEISQKCYLSINTVKTYVRSAYRKAGVATRAQAVAWAMRNGFNSERTAS